MFTLSLLFRPTFYVLSFVLLFAQGHAGSTVVFPASLKSWSAEVAGVPVVYHFVDLNGWDTLAYAQTEWPAQRCHVYLDVWLFNSPSELVKLALHELGHCVDLFVLDFDHNGVGWGDCGADSHACRPEERYADAWRAAYLSACGASLYPVGFVDEAEQACALPDPRAVTISVRVAPAVTTER